MFFLCFALKDKIVHINTTFALMNHVSEEHLHHAHKGSWQIAQIKVHDGGLKEAFQHEEGSFPFMAFLNTYVVVSPDNVHLGEQFSIFEHIEKIIDAGQWGFIFDG